MTPDDDPLEGPKDIAIEHVLDQLEELETFVSDEAERTEVQRVRSMLEHVPGTKTIHKYTSRDMGEAFVGGLIFSLPLLVEDGVFDIAAWFAAHTVGPLPIFLALNVIFVVAVATGLLYAVDIREVKITDPLLGIFPRRLVGVLVISFVCAAGMMLMWGRLHEGDPTALESLARATVIWASAVLGAVLADILPGESKGEDVTTLIGGAEGPAPEGA